MKKFVLSLSILIFFTTNVFSAGSSGGDGGSSATKTNYEKAVVHIKSAKKHEKKGKLEKAKNKLFKSAKIFSSI